MATLFFIIIAFFLLCHSGKFALNFFEIFLIFTGQGGKKWFKKELSKELSFQKFARPFFIHRSLKLFHTMGEKR